jgi:hypothetical protein
MKQYIDDVIERRGVDPLSAQAEVGGRWYIARPLPFYSWRIRLRQAWDVFRYRADAFYWRVDDAIEEEGRRRQ